MKMTLGVLCDAANTTANGKLNILGEFNTIFSTTEPVVWPMFVLVARLEASTVEGTDHFFEIDLIDADGQSLVAGDRPSSQFRLNPTGPGRPLRGQLILNMQGVTFNEFGSYEFHLLVDRKSVGKIPVHIMLHEGPPPD